MLIINGSPSAASVALKTLSPLSLVVAEGYYAATTLDTVDADLVTGNIKSGATIFGVAGKAQVVDTTEAGNPAAAANITTGKIAFVNGVKITGIA